MALLTSGLKDRCDILREGHFARLAIPQVLGDLLDTVRGSLAAREVLERQTVVIDVLDLGDIPYDSIRTAGDTDVTEHVREATGRA